MNELFSGQVPNSNEIRRYRPHVLVTIVDRSQAQRVADILQKNEVHIQFICLAEGTASSDIMDLLGLGSTDKTLVICLVPSCNVSTLLTILSERLKLTKASRGIAFTIPLSGVNSPVLHVLDKEIHEEFQNEMKKEVEEMSINSNHDLIVAVINQGYSEDLMAAAKTAGATGGTVIHARRINTEEAAKFFGISVHGEKEIVAILASHDEKQEIMRAIGHSSGLKTDAKGIIFSLPVSGIAGLSSGNLEDFK